MNWMLVIVSLVVLGVALVVGLVIVMYTSVSKYAKRFDPNERPRDDKPAL